jgi:hypothetical protein
MDYKYAGEFVGRFRLVRRPKHNKKELRHLGRKSSSEIDVACGDVRLHGKTKYIVRTANIVNMIIDDAGVVGLFTSNGKYYRYAGGSNGSQADH